MAKAGRHRYSIGIDLGTSNCALAYLDLREKGAAPRILEIPQWQAEGRSITGKVLPSFAWFPASGAPVVGMRARDMAALEPGRTAFSAKSWLTHAGVDRRARLLPWGSEQMPPGEKRSPVEVSALYLEYLKSAWNGAMAGGDGSGSFDRQHIVITVPASFDQGAQNLTLEAARLAGYPPGVRLLEEPQAAFYAWLEGHPDPGALGAALGLSESGASATVLVCDIGGGTTDFSSFSVAMREGGGTRIRRLAVSDHILLGGDNIDLAIARLLEARASGNGELSDPTAWQRLVAESRRIKEAALQELSRQGSTGGGIHRVGIAGAGGNLFEQTKTASVSDLEIAALVDEGFFPRAAATDRPRAAGKGLREMGLPYAADSAVTRYLAGFLSRGEPVDAILFNGGAMTPAYLQRRIRDLVGDWQPERKPPAILENPEPDLAVARGAAAYGRYPASGLKPRISAGSGHGYYLEAAAREKQAVRYLICILPLGAETEQEQVIAKLDLRLALNRPVEFRLYDSIHRHEDRAGNILKYSPEEFRELPPLRTVARLDAGRAAALGSEGAAVGIRASLNGLGLLRVQLFTSDKRLHPPARWDLEFDMRAQDPPRAEVPDGKSEAPGKAEEILEPEMLARAEAILSSPFPTGVLGLLETALGRNRGAWPRSWLRRFWEPLYASMGRRGLDPEYEAAWLNAAGYFLRPGFGDPLDGFRIDSLWAVHALGPAHGKHKAVRAQYWLMWRRVAGGLSAPRQEDLFREAQPLIESHHPLAEEAVRMAGSFERLDPGHREWLLEAFLEGVDRKREAHIAPYLFALGRLLSRVPLYAGEESVLPPAAVERCFACFRDWNWADPRNAYLPVLFSQAGRVTNHRSIDIPAGLRGAIEGKMREAGANPALLRRVSEFVPMEREDLNRLLGDALPLGLAIRTFS